MSVIDRYACGAPCWVDTWQPDPGAVEAFYTQLFGWRLDRVPTATGGTYLNASLGGRLVAGVGQAPVATPAVWVLNIRVDEIEPAIRNIEAAGGRPLVDALNLGEQGRIAVMSDSTGVSFAIWEPRSRQGAELIGTANTWAMSALHTTDLRKAERFYGSAFGWELVRVPDTELCDWRLNGERIAVAALTDGRSVPAHWAINFAVGDVDTCATSACSFGGTVLVPPTDGPGFRSAVIADPRGGVFAVSAPAQQAAAGAFENLGAPAATRPPFIR